MLVAAVAAVVALPGATLSARVATSGYVTSSLTLPRNPTEANALGRDIDHNGKVDNAFGQFVAALASSGGVDVAGATQSAVDAGKILMLHSVRTVTTKNRKTRKTTKRTTWQVLYAQQTESPDFSGAGVFTVDKNALRSLLLRAHVKNHHVQTAAGSIPIALDFGGGAFTLHLTAAQIDATCTASGCTNGRITGVITGPEIVASLLPEVADQFTAIVARDCPGPDSSSCASGSSGQTMESIFDLNHDLAITAAELQQNALIQSLFSPDIDTNHDSKKDALSVGVGFETVKAKIKRP